MLYSRSLNIKIKRRRENIIFKIIDFNIIKEFWRKFMCGIVGFTGNEYYGAPGSSAIIRSFLFILSEI